MGSRELLPPFQPIQALFQPLQALVEPVQALSDSFHAFVLGSATVRANVLAVCAFLESVSGASTTVSRPAAPRTVAAASWPVPAPLEVVSASTTHVFLLVLLS